MAKGLTAQQQAFVDYLLADEGLSAAAAYRKAYPKSSAKAAESSASVLLRNPKVADAIAEAQQARSERTGITADRVLEQWWMIATADPNELIEHRRTCCRHCYGEGFGYQRTAGEMARDRDRWERSQKKAQKDNESTPEPFNEAGGEGYDARLDPNPACPECFGEGVPQVFPKDTRRLSPAARLLYAGVKQTKDGFEVKMRDQDGALANVARHLGMFVDRVESRDLTLEAMLDQLEPVGADGG